MEDTKSIEKKLGGSDAYKSLRSEKEVAECLQRHAWEIRHSPYYADLKTGKSREIDVTASAYWNKPLSSGDLVARVNLFVEVKSNSNFHVLFAGEAEQQTHYNANEHWLGYSETAIQRIENTLTRFNLGFDATKRIIQRVEKIAFPRQTMRTSSLRVDPPTVQESYTAFRETNGATEKELDSSVLWRASLSLRSAIESAQADLIDGLENDITTDFESARREKKPFESALHSVDSHSCRLNLYIPIVVVQSRLWSAREEVPRELKWARLVQYNTFGSADGWTDVVNDRYFDEYIDSISSHFDSKFRAVRAKRWM